jgi:hypothetical protein
VVSAARKIPQQQQQASSPNAGRSGTHGVVSSVVSGSYGGYDRGRPSWWRRMWPSRHRRHAVEVPCL